MIDFSDSPGWPAKSTRVHIDPSRIGPRVLRKERRAECLEANAKWLATPGAAEKARLAKLSYHRSQKSRRGVAP